MLVLFLNSREESKHEEEFYFLFCLPPDCSASYT